MLMTRPSRAGARRSWGSALAVAAADLTGGEDVGGRSILGFEDGLVRLEGEPERRVGLDAAHQLPGAFDLGVQLGAEQQHDVRDPDPQQEDDHSGEGAVRLVVASEVADIEGEQGGGDAEQYDRGERTG